MKYEACIIKGVPFKGNPEILIPEISLSERRYENLENLNLRVKMLHVGICGTDIHTTRIDQTSGKIKSSAPLTLQEEGIIFGHEGVGKILDVGRDVPYFKPDMHVTFESIYSCGYCSSCRQGLFNQCMNAYLLGLQKDGVFSEIVDIPYRMVHEVPNRKKGSMGLMGYALVEPAAVSLVGLENSRIKPSDTLLIMGGGPIGLLAADIASSCFGVGEIFLIEKEPYRLDMARDYADHCFQSLDEFIEYQKHTKRGINVFLEASGYVKSVDDLFTTIAPNGKVVLLSREEISLHLTHIDHMITNQISIIGSRGHLGGAMQKIISQIQMGKLDIDKYITSTKSGLDKLVNDINYEKEAIMMKNCKMIYSL